MQVIYENLLTQPKRCRHWSGFRCKANHRGLLIGTANLVDMEGISIPGLTLQIEVRIGTISGDCLMMFSIFQLIGQRRRCMYRLEICPPDKRSHNAAEPIYGPHEHLGETEVRAVVQTGVNCTNWHACLAWFLSRTNIEYFDVDSPYEL